MEKLTFSFALITLLGFSAYTQNLNESRASAISCFEDKLKTINEDFSYLVNAIDETARMNSEDEFRLFVNAFVKQLEKAGFSDSNGMDYGVVCDCLQSSYDLIDSKNDTMSGYHIMLKQYSYLENNVFNLNPDSLMHFIDVVYEKSEDKKFSKGVLSFIMFDLLYKISDNPSVPVDIKKEEIEVKVLAPIDEESQSKGEHRIYDVVEDEPKFPGGEEALEEYFKFENVTEEAKVYVQFIVTDKGDVIEPRILRGHPDYNDQVLKQVVKMPKWEPGKQRGEAVFVRYTMPVVIK